MADYSFSSLTTAKYGFVVSTVQIGSTVPSSSVDPSQNYKRFENFVMSNLQKQTPGFLTGRRLGVGQLYPRGVYNK